MENIKFCMTKFLALLFPFLIISCHNKDNIKIISRDTSTVNLYSDSIITYITYNAQVKVENIRTSEIIYERKLENDNHSHPVLGKQNDLYYSLSDNLFCCADIKSKKQIWSFKTDEKIINYKLVNEDIVLLSVRNWGIIALNPKNGSKLYAIKDVSKDCSDSLFKDFVFNKDCLFVNDFQCNTIIAFSLKDGNEVWHFKSDVSGVSQSLIIGNYIFCGVTGDATKYMGKVILIDAKNGKIIYEKETPFDLITKPILYSNKVFYYTYDSRLNEFDLEKKTAKIVYEFKKNEFACGYQFSLIDNRIYFSDCNFNLNRFDLNTYDNEVLGRAPSILLGVYRLNNKIEFLY